MNEFLHAAIVSIILIAITTLIYYEVLRVVWGWLPRMQMAPRRRILLVMAAIFFGHTLSVWVYGIAYWWLVEYGGHSMGALAGNFEEGFFSFIYFSASTYSSLGFGDVYPTGGLRLITGVEVLNGLMLIGWSASFTYLVMEKFWGLHGKGK